ncbi:zinc finger protein draculin-like [Wyeomyia smithii]|uniref:zinc finger protein draculin-like n=1 Tax=Wyeomyia smithii TaxID=174621 RepID=UPI0024681732|nr:zinc finger protein draculin-like [Wyeomyia smithii]
MAIFNLKNFPDVCRLCIQPKTSVELIPIETSTLANVDRTLLELLDEITSEIPKDVPERLPNAICSTCFAVFEFVVQYQQKIKLLTKFIIALAHLKAGSSQAILDIFSTDGSKLKQIIKELGLCRKEEVQVEDFLEEFNAPNAKLDEEVFNETKLPSTEGTGMKCDYTEYYNVEYIDEDSQSKVQELSEVKYSEEPIVEYLVEIDDENETIKNVSNKCVAPIDTIQKSKPKVRMLQCNYCAYRTTSKDMFQNHIERHEHPDDENPWKCSYSKCSEAYPTKEDLLRHKKEIHSKYVCDICGTILKHKYTLEVHLRRHAGDSKYPCQYCSTSYFTANELKLHLSVMHLAVADAQCSTCGLAFKNKKSLRLHEKAHSNQRSFPCDECSMAFKTSAHQRRHHNTVHRVIKFHCTLCRASYGRKDKLRMHMEKAHKIQTYFPCHICLKSFSAADDLEEHMMHHRNPKHLECGTCLAAFTEQVEFNDHLCITYRDDYVCCDRDFKFHLQYNKHMFLAHGLRTNVRVKLASNQLLGATRASRKAIERCTRCGQSFPTRKQKKEHTASCNMDQQMDLPCLETVPFHENLEGSLSFSNVQSIV